MTDQNYPPLACAMLRGTLALPQLSGRMRLYRRTAGVQIKLYISGLPTEEKNAELFLQLETLQGDLLFRNSISCLQSGNANLSVFSDSFSIFEALEGSAEITAGKKTVLARGIIRRIEGSAPEI